MLTIKGSRLIPMAGIDESNADGHYILWPRDAQQSANALRAFLCERFSLRQVGVLITDSTTAPLRSGVTGIAVAHSGFSALNSYIGAPDLFGRTLRMTRANVAEGLAAAAVLAMGEGSEGTPIAVISEAAFVVLQDRDPTEGELADLRITPESDLYAAMLRAVPWQTKREVACNAHADCCIMEVTAGNPAPGPAAPHDRSMRPVVRQIVVAFDGSEGAEEALRDLTSAGLPDDLGACVMSVSDHAAFFGGEAGANAGSESHRALARGSTGACLRLAEQAGGRLSALFPSWRVEAAAQDGPAAPAIIAAALERQADMVVLGAHGRSHCPQLLLGSCSRRVLMHGPCSVRIARPRRRPAGASLRLLVALDDSDKARACATVAAVAARSWPADTEVHLIAIVDEGADRRHLSPAAAMDAWKRRHSAAADARACAALEEHWSVLRRAGFRGETMLFEGDAALTLVRYATDWEADCVFVAWPPKRGSTGTLADDSAFITAARAPCSVELVRWQNPAPAPPGHAGCATAQAASS
jgi:nucleotide-binding universal stress UspA family protein